MDFPFVLVDHAVYFNVNIILLKLFSFTFYKNAILNTDYWKPRRTLPTPDFLPFLPPVIIIIDRFELIEKKKPRYKEGLKIIKKLSIMFINKNKFVFLTAKV